MAIGACTGTSTPCLDTEKIVKKPGDKTAMEWETLATRLISSSNSFRQRIIGDRRVDEEGEDG